MEEDTSTPIVENETQQIHTATVNNNSNDDVGFPVAKKKKKSKKLIYVILVVVILGLVAGGGYFLLTKPNFDDEGLAELDGTTTIEEITSTPTPTVTDEKPVREGVNIEVLNGTGLAGEAGKLKDSLESLGYEDVDAGNASKQDYEVTEIIFSQGVSQAVKNDIEKHLQGLYEDVNSTIGDAGSFDVQIITGFPKGHTPTPTVKATSTPTATPTGSATTTTTITPTQTPTATPTGN